MTTAIPHTPLTVQRFADSAHPEPRHVLEMARKHGVRMVDFKFTDLPGTWQHVSLSIHGLAEEAFEEGLGFDGSSIRGFQEISESDMILIPDPSTAILDPFHEQQTMSIVCNIFDPITREPYSRDPRYVAMKAERHLRSTGIADTCFMGPEAEFFIFDHVAFDQRAHTAFYEVDSHEAYWNTGRGFFHPGLHSTFWFMVAGYTLIMYAALVWRVMLWRRYRPMESVSDEQLPSVTVVTSLRFMRPPSGASSWKRRHSTASRPRLVWATPEARPPDTACGPRRQWAAPRAAHIINRPHAL